MTDDRWNGSVTGHLSLLKGAPAKGLKRFYDR